MTDRLGPLELKCPGDKSRQRLVKEGVGGILALSTKLFV